MNYNLNQYTSYILTITKYILFAGPQVFARFQRQFVLAKVLKPYREAKFINLRTYAIYAFSYVAKSLNIEEKLQILTYHYGFLKKIFKPTVLDELFKKGIECWKENNNQDIYNVTLAFNDILEFEGSLALIFKVGETKIFTLSFTFSPGNIFDLADATVIYISCMQGAKNEFENYSKATKYFKNNIPPVILVKVLEAIANAFNIKTILGVSTENQLSFDETSDFNNFNNNYNKFWENIGGTNVNNKHYLFNCPLPEKPITSITQKYRSRVIAKRKRLEEIRRVSYYNMKCFVNTDKIPHIKSAASEVDSPYFLSASSAQ